MKMKGLDRERRKKDQNIWVRSESGLTSSINRNRHLDRSRMYQGGVKNKISIDWEVLKAKLLW